MVYSEPVNLIVGVLDSSGIGSHEASIDLCLLKNSTPVSM